MNEGKELVPILECRKPPVIYENLMDLGAYVQGIAQKVQALPRDKENLAEVKKLRAELRKRFEALETQRKQVKAEVMAPYDRANEMYKRLVAAPIEAADKLCKAFVDDVETAAKEACEQSLRDYFTELCQVKGIYWLSFDRLGIRVDMATANLKEPKKVREQIRSFVEGVDQALISIQTMEDSQEILDAYMTTLDLAKAIAKVSEQKKRMENLAKTFSRWEDAKASRTGNAAAVAAAAPEIGMVSRAEPPVKKFRVIFAATAPIAMLRALKEYMQSHGIEFEEVNNG